MQNTLQYYGNMQIAFVVFVLYYGVAVLTLDDTATNIPDNAYADAAPFLKRMLFPISYVGMGVRLSRWGMAAEQAETSIGALVVMWSAQATLGKIMDAVDALML